MKEPQKAPEVPSTEGASSFADTGPSDMHGWSQPPEAILPGVDRPPAIAGFEIERLLGRGGMGVVYLAIQVRLRRQVALKLLSREIQLHPQAKSRFQSEAEAAARLSHPNIIPVFEVGDSDGCPFLAMEYAPGGSLADALAGTPLQPRLAAELVAKLAEGVQHAHSAGIIHRDLKPANVLLDKSIGTNERESGLASTQPRLSDFGLAKFLDGDSSSTRTGQVLGTPSYMAPEQAAGQQEIGPAVDIYALGAILYECLTGRPPFKGASWVETTRLVAETDPVSPRRLNPSIPKDLETVCLKCLEKLPERRYSSAVALRDDLKRFAEGLPVLARPVGPATRAWKYAKRHPGISGLGFAAATFLLVLIVGGWITNRRLESERDKAKASLADAERAVRSSLELAEHLNLAGNAVQAEVAVREVIAFLDPFLIANPENPNYQELMARAQYLLGRTITDKPDPDVKSCEAAEAADLTAINLYLKLLQSDGGKLEWKAKVANIKNNIAYAKSLRAKKSSKLEADALISDGDSLLSEAEASFRDILLVDPKSPNSKSELGNLLNTRSYTHINFKFKNSKSNARIREWLLEAIELQKSAQALDPNNIDYPNRLKWHLGNLVEVTIKMGDHRTASRITRSELLARYPGDLQLQFGCTTYFANCAALAERDTSLTEKARRDLAKEYALEAISWLKRFNELHYFLNPLNAADLRSEKAYEPLKGYPEFQQILQNAAPPPKSK